MHFAADPRIPMHKGDGTEEGFPQHKLPLALSAHMLRRKGQARGKDVLAAVRSEHSLLALVPHCLTHYLDGFAPYLNSPIIFLRENEHLPPFGPVLSSLLSQWQQNRTFLDAPHWCTASNKQHEAIMLSITALYLKAFTSVPSYHHKSSCISSLHPHPASSCCAKSLWPL